MGTMNWSARYCSLEANLEANARTTKRSKLSHLLFHGHGQSWNERMHWYLRQAGAYESKLCTEARRPIVAVHVDGGCKESKGICCRQ